MRRLVGVALATMLLSGCGGEPYEDDPKRRADYELGRDILGPDGAFGPMRAPNADDCVMALQMWEQSGEPVEYNEAFLEGCEDFVKTQ